MEVIKQQLLAYKKRFFIDKLIKSFLLFLLLAFGIFLIFNVLEFNFRFGSIVRAILLFSFLGFSIAFFFFRIATPLWELVRGGKSLSDKEAAVQIGRFFPEVKDKLLNMLQLQSMQQAGHSLLNASIEQKSAELSTIKFANAVKIKASLGLFRYVSALAGIIILLLLLVPQMFTESTARIIQYNKSFTPPPPFTFQLLNQSLEGFVNEDFVIRMKINGKNTPDQVYLETNKRKIRISGNREGIYEFTFPKMLTKSSFHFAAAGYTSTTYHVTLRNRPFLKNFNVHLHFPAYIAKPNQTLENIGNFEVPEGTEIKWQMTAGEAEKLWLKFENKDSALLVKSSDNQLFEVQKKLFSSQYYEVHLANKYSRNKDLIRYRINIVKDAAPSIQAEVFQDTTLLSFVVLGGSVSDDYGITTLKLHHQVEKEHSKNKFVAINIPIAKGRSSQGFYFQWKLDSLNLKEGERLSYYMEVTDNDEVNGHKSTKTGLYYMRMPTRKEVKKLIEKQAKGTEKSIDKGLSQAQQIQEQIQEIENRLKTKKKLDWQDEKLLQELLERKEELSQNIDKLKQENKSLDERREHFTESSPQLKQKMEQLQSLMDELLDDETKQLYEELKKLLEEKGQLNEVQKMMDKISNKEEDLEKELERALELFNRMKFDLKLEEVIKKTEETQKKQEELSEKTKDKENSTEELMQEQQELGRELEELDKEVKELNELNKELKEPEKQADISEEKKEAKELQEKSLENLKENKRKKASESQQKSAEQMQKMVDKFQQMQEGMQMQALQENMENLRNIVDNLVKLSFGQEELMNSFREVNQSDPRFLELSEKQIKLKDDAQIVKDSLLALANRVFQISSFVTREVNAMNNHMDESLNAIKDRNRSLAVSKQQFTMTSINNLALLLDDVLRQMQEQMANAMGSPKKGNSTKKSNMPSLSNLQKQLNEKIDALKKSGKTGRELSEELAKLAAEQEMLRRELQQLQETLDNGKEGQGKESGDAIRKMEQTERDLVNKRLGNITKHRQEEIQTRLLEAENAMREREQSQEREGEAAKEFERKIPAVFEEYKQLKEKEIELLKTIPPKLNPYYKREVNDYFKRIGGQ